MECEEEKQEVDPHLVRLRVMLEEDAIEKEKRYQQTRDHVRRLLKEERQYPVTLAFITQSEYYEMDIHLRRALDELGEGSYLCIRYVEHPGGFCGKLYLLPVGMEIPVVPVVPVREAVPAVVPVRGDVPVVDVRKHRVCWMC
jgi:hypothetical protein